MPATLPALSAEARPPDWNLVPFPVTCARCSTDLRGRVESKCPACALEFDWAEACPIERLKCTHCGYHLYGLQESRCPECGKGFTWTEALAEYRRTRSDLFEYRWHDRPLRSFVKTWWRSLRPGKFWRTVNIHDPPRLGPLAVHAIGILFIGALTFILWHAALLTVSFWHSMGAPRGPGMAFWMRSLLMRINRLPTGWIVTDATWVLFSVLPLYVLQQTMSRFRIRHSHVVRIGCYAVPIALGLGVLCFLAVVTPGVCLHGAPWGRWWARGTMPLSVQIGRYAVWFAAILAIGFAGWSTYCAYRHYLKLPHNVGIAIMSQIIACLATAIVYLQLTLQ